MHPKLKVFITVSILLSLSSMAYLASIMLSDNNDYLLPKPNLVLFSVDTLRADHLEIYHYHRSTAPNLAKMAKDGFIFDSAFTVSTHSAPAHAAMLTGLYPMQHGQVQNGLELPEQIHTLAEYLQQDGYTTAAFVSDIVLSKESNLHQGFESIGVDHINSGSPIHITQSWAARVWKRSQAWLKQWSQKVSQQQAQGKDYQRQPFFLWLHANHPHGNYNPPPGYRNLFVEAPAPSLQAPLKELNDDLDKLIRRALRNNTVSPELIEWVENLYDGEIRFADSIFGQLVQFLKRINEYDRTVIIFVSDHGEVLFEHIKPGQERSAAHHAGLYYESVLKIPMVIKPSIHFKGPRGQRVQGQVTTLDLFTTAFELLGLNPPPSPNGQSQNLIPLMQNPDTEPGHPRTYFGEILFKNRCSGLRDQDWRFIRCDSPKDGSDDPSQKISKSVLYHLAKDPQQRIDQYQDFPEKAQEMEQYLERWLKNQQYTRYIAPQDMSGEMRRALEAGGYLKVPPATKPGF